MRITGIGVTSKTARFFLLVFTVGLGIVLLFSLTPYGKAAIKAALLVSEFAGEFRLEAPRFLHLFSKSPSVTLVEISTAQGSLSAELYMPAGVRKKIPAAIFAYGIVPDYRDSRIVKLSEALARSGIAVLVPHFSEFKEERVHEKTVSDMVDAFLFLEAHPMINPNKIGFMGFCVGGSLAFVASANSAIANNVQFIHLLSPYYDLYSYAAAVFSEQYRRGEDLVAWRPDSQALRVFRNELLLLLPLSDQNILRDELLKTNSGDPKQYEKLSSDGKLVREIFESDSYEKVVTLSGQLSVAYRENWHALSPAAYIEEVKAPVFIATGYDTVIPSSESEEFAAALGAQAKLTKFDVLSHVSPSGHLGSTQKTLEALRLWNHIRNTLREIL